MDAIWLAWCDSEAYPALRREVSARDAAAQVLRVSDADALEHLAGACAASWDEVSVILSNSAVPLLEQAVERIAHGADAQQLVVVTPCLEPGHIARLFRNGATEVIAQERSAPAADIVDTELDEARKGDVPVSFREAGRPGDGALPAAAYVSQRGAQTCVDDLDEPDDVLIAARDEDAPRADQTGVLGSAAANAGEARARSSGVRASVPDPMADQAAPAEQGTRAPLVAAVSGRGGSGVTTLIASMALRAAGCGLRTAVLDLDLMFGNLAAALGVEQPGDLASILPAARAGALSEDDVMRASRRVRPGLTLWGPVHTPEHAELMGQAVEMLLGVLRCEADVIFVDTSRYWSDASAAAIAQCDRCLIVGSGGMEAPASAARVLGLASRIGVPRTRMTSVFNRLAPHEGGEDAAARFEFACALSSQARVADGGREVGELAVLGRLAEHLERPGAFQESVRAVTDRLLIELGCPVDTAVATASSEPPVASVRRLRLPWRKQAGDAA